jgi:hypothetical protein
MRRLIIVFSFVGAILGSAAGAALCWLSSVQLDLDVYSDDGNSVLMTIPGDENIAGLSGAPSQPVLFILAVFGGVTLGLIMGASVSFLRYRLVKEVE